MSQSFLIVEIGSMLASMLNHPQTQIQKAALISISKLCINSKYYAISNYAGWLLTFLFILRGDQRTVN